jgi:chloramphenicol 3-O phosphotransferase
MAPGKIIVLNGASSSGKTTILTELQEILPEPYLNAGIDKFIWMLPKRYLDRPLWDDVLGLADRAGTAGHRLFSGMHRAVAALADCGNNVIADHVLVEKSWLCDCARLFATLPAYLVGIRCPLEILEQRERSRKDRTLGQARLQYELVHAHGIYDLEVDTSLLSPGECAEKIMARVQSGDPPRAFSRIMEACACD